MIQMLCQLSYSPIVFRSDVHQEWAHLDSNQGLTGYEPAALDR